MSRVLLLALSLSRAIVAAEPGPQALPFFFVPNRGQAPADVRYMTRGSGLTAHLLASQIELRLAGLTVTLRFEGANTEASLESGARLLGRANFFYGSPSAWRTDIPLFDSVVYRDLYSGIDLHYAGAGRNLKSEFVLAPGADPARIRMRYAGAEPPRLDPDGSLVVPAGGVELRERPPLVYQEGAAGREFVEARFVLHADGTVGFVLGAYDHARTLIIDPVLAYSSLFGGSGSESALGLAVDSTGAAYIAGFTDSLNLPATNPAQSFSGGGNDVFVAKLSPGGTSLVYCTYLGGAVDDRASAIAVDSLGSVYLTGSTTSKNFPVRAAVQAKLTGYRNVFVTKLNPAGNALVYSTYLGGNASDTAYGIAIDSSGAAYIAGDTTSFSFPATGYQRGTRGGQDAFAAKLSADGSHLVYSTYLGGASEDHAAAIAVDSSGAAWIAGATTSTDFPVLNAVQSNNAGGQDAYVTRLSPGGNSLIFSTYLGGSGGTVMYPEIAQAIAIDLNGYAYTGGVTSSLDFPLIAAIQTGRRGQLDAFAAKISPAGSLVYSTYLGGSSVDVANAIAVDAGGAAYVAGYTISTDLPVASPLQNAIAGDYDAFLARLSPAGAVVQFLTYLGGNGSDSATAVALDSAANAYLAGYTLSTNFPLLHPVQANNSGNYGAFVTKIDFTGVRTSAVISLSATRTGTFVQGGSAGYAITVSNQAGAPSTTGAVTVSDTLPAGLTLTSMAGSGWSCSSNSCTRSDPLPGGSSYPPITVAVNISPTAASPQNNSVAVSGGGAAPAFVNDSTPIAILPLWGISSTHSGNWLQGQTATYSVNVWNLAGAGPSTGAVTVTDALPAGLVLVSMSGAGWTCAANSCTRADSLAGGASYPVISVNVTIALNASSPQINSVTVSGGAGASQSAIDSTALYCSFQLTGSNAFPALSATGVASIATDGACSWTASTSAAWLHIASPASGSGNGQLFFSVDANASAAQRTATLTAGAASLTIYQGGNIVQPGSGLRFVPATPCRIADTRIGTGPYGGPAVGLTPREFSVAASACGIPATAQAYSLNLTVVPSGTLDALYAWPTGQAQPGVPNLSSTDGRIKADMAIVAAGTNGAITIAASHTTHVIIDINGYFVLASGAADLAFYPVAPCRLVDTRIGTGALAGPAIAASQIRTFPVLSSPCNVAVEARAYALNVTVVPSSSLGFVSIWPAGNPQPVVSTLNAPTGAITANAAIVPAGADGAITVIASHNTALILDINGYFAPPAPGGLQFYPQTPCRIADTRSAAGPFGAPQASASSRRDFLVSASACAVPLTASAYSLNSTVIPPASMGFLSLWGAGGQPTVSTLNASDGAITMNTALVPAGPGGTISAFTSHITHLLLDINGYFAP